MKKRTIEDIRYDLGNLEFAWFVDTAIKDGHTITNIEEYDGKFRFKMDGNPMDFFVWMDKKRQLESCYRILESRDLFKLLSKKYDEEMAKKELVQNIREMARIPDLGLDGYYGELLPYEIAFEIARILERYITGELEDLPSNLYSLIQEIAINYDRKKK